MVNLTRIFLFISVAITTSACTLYSSHDHYFYSNTLVWSDEFSGGSIDSAKWKLETGNTGWGNSEWQNYTRSSENIYLENGNLILQAVYNSNGYANGNFTSARLNTKSCFEFTYGRVEARILLPKGKGIWPAFWMLGATFPNENWPNCGEIDIMENLGNEPKEVYGTIHGPGYTGASAFSSSTTIEEDKFHVFSILWLPNKITWFVDDNQFFEIEAKQLSASQKWKHDGPYFLLLNLAVGGDWPGYPDETTIFPQKMVVDWVRVYR